MGGTGSCVSVIRIVGFTVISNISSGFGCIVVVVAVVDTNLFLVLLMMFIMFIIPLSIA